MRADTHIIHTALHFSHHIRLDPKPNPVVADIEAHEEVHSKEKRQRQLQDSVRGGLHNLRWHMIK